jgi:Tat protein secretion system quality control protein TatD with DNase activity
LSREERKIVPAFGWHPWFSHELYDETKYEGRNSLSQREKADHYRQILTPSLDDEAYLQSLPDPSPMGIYLARMKVMLEKYPVALLGEVGLDRSFRIPEPWQLKGQAKQRDAGKTEGGREQRKLSPYRVSIDHQKVILLAQLRLAGQMQRAASVHGVQAHGHVYDALAEVWKGYENHVPSQRDRKKLASAISRNAEPVEDESASDEVANVLRPFPPRICLHSYSGSADAISRYLAPTVPCEVFFSFSTTINSWADDRSGKVEAAVKAVPDDKVLVESDLDTAGENMDAALKEAVLKICEIRNWPIEDGVKRLGENWRRFVFGR